jgi:hypothetical protein
MYDDYSAYKKAVETALYALEQAKRSGGSDSRESWAAIAEAASRLASATR